MKLKYIFYICTSLLLVAPCHATTICKELNSDWSFRQVDNDRWLEAEVPGCVHTDLIRHNLIEDPFYRLNEHKVQWVDKKDWEYRTSFEVGRDILDKGSVNLIFKGLDTYADVYVNDNKVLSADNMFIEHKVDVKHLLRKGNNQLRIYFHSPINEGVRRYDAAPYTFNSKMDLSEIGQVEGNKKVGMFGRKAPYHFGWDWGPRLVSSGICAPVILSAWDQMNIVDLQIRQNNLTTNKAQMTATLEIDALESGKATIEIRNNGKTAVSKEVSIEKGNKTYNVDFSIDKPKLWWPNGLGEQPLYTIEANAKSKTAVTHKSQRIGLRTVELVRENDSDGISFYFKVNGHPVFMKGANYIPSDIFQTRVTDQMYRNLIGTAKLSNFNMIRIWGGGIYEKDIFYDLCDEAGILVWQDFMYACSMYPGDDKFLSNVKEEAAYQIKRLRNHPSIAMWCGNNEILAGWQAWGWKKKAIEAGTKDIDQMWDNYVKIFHKIIPQQIETYDNQRPYWSSSPSAGLGVVRKLNTGDDHFWGVWHARKPFSEYQTHIARFMSEYGFQSFPEMRTVKTYTAPEDYDIFSEVMQSHQRSPIGNSTIDYYMMQEYDKRPRDFESFLYVGQVIQAEGIKFALEGHRRASPFCMGTLYWQFNDCWPVASWSSIDYFQRWKALQYFAKKGFEPLLVSPYIQDSTLGVNIINDKLEKLNATLQLSVLDISGKEVWKKSIAVDIPANSNAKYYEVNLQEFLRDKDKSRNFLVAKLIAADKVCSENTLYFCPVKELALEAPKLKLTTTAIDGGYKIGISTDKLAKNVYLSIGDNDGFFSDNYFDLYPGSVRYVTLQSSISKELLNETLRTRTLADAF